VEVRWQTRRELLESMVVTEGIVSEGTVGKDESHDGNYGTSDAGAAPKKPRAKRPSGKSVEGRVAVIEQQMKAFAQNSRSLLG
jgi:hypothetical protein